MNQRVFPQLRMTIWPVFVLMSSIASATRVQDGPLYIGMCDASAAVAVGTKGFVVANDEDNVLRLYRRDSGGLPIARFDLSDFLQTDREHPEADIEGATWLGDRIYWITSHGRNKDGKKRSSRQRLFATAFARSPDGMTLDGVGRPYRDLLDDLLRDKRLAQYDLAAAAKRAPKSPAALNIEGLAATPDGRLLIGFRNPIPKGKALVVPLENPQEMVDGQPARLGDPIELDLGGRGIRSMEYDAEIGSYWIIAGPYDDETNPQLFQWTGRPVDVPRPVSVEFTSLAPEAMVIYPDRNGAHRAIQILVDDGTKKVAGMDCKTVEQEQLRSFRSFWLDDSPSEVP